MKITFTFWQLIGILILTLICYLIFPWFYNSWMFPEYDKFGNITDYSGFGRLFSGVFGTIMLIIYLGPMNGVRHLNKKRSITLKNPFKD